MNQEEELKPRYERAKDENGEIMSKWERMPTLKTEEAIAESFKKALKESDEIAKKLEVNPSWGKGFAGGVENINLKGRKGMDKKSNKELRMSAMMSLVRMLKPHIGKSVMVASKIIDDPKASDSNKLAAARMMIALYRDTIRDAYDSKYDTEEGEKINKIEDNAPVFSMKMIDVN